MKSRYPTSVFKLISRGLVVCLALILPLHVQAADDEGAWKITEIVGLVTYRSHGAAVYGHLFGFVKRAGRCQSDILWLSWSSTNPQIEQLTGTEVTFLIDVDGTAFKIGVNLGSTSSALPTTSIAVFTNFITGPVFIDLLNRGTKIKIEIVGPPEAHNLFDILSDEFSLTGFAKARQQAKALCEGD